MVIRGILPRVRFREGLNKHFPQLVAIHTQSVTGNVYLLVSNGKFKWEMGMGMGINGNGYLLVYLMCI
jgi:hypothetical protein